MVGTHRADELEIPRRAHAGDLGSQHLGDLHRERPDAARRAVDQHPLPGLDATGVAQAVERRQGRRRDGGRLLEGQLRRLRDDQVGLRAHELGAGAEAAAEDLVAGSQMGDAPANSLDHAGDIEPGHAELRPPQAGHEAHRERRAEDAEQVAGVQARGAGADEHLAGADRRRVDLAQPEEVGGSVSVMGDGPHRSGAPCAMLTT